MVGRSWDVFQPLLFGLIGAEITIATLSPSTVGKNNAKKTNKIISDIVNLHLQELPQTLLKVQHVLMFQ